MKRKSVSGIIVVLLTLSMTFFMPISWEHGETGTEVVVINPDTGDTDFIFYTDTTSIGTRFNATVWLYNVSDLFAYQVFLTVDDTLLNITNAWLPTWNSSWVFYGQTTVRPPSSFRDTNANGVMEAVMIGDTLFSWGTPFAGDGLLAIIEFEIIYEPISGSVFCNLGIDNADTYLLDSGPSEIPALKQSGFYEFRKMEPPLGDVNRDYVVDQYDLSLISESLWTNLGDPRYNPDADLNKDGVIDENDIILFQDYWKQYLFG